MGVLREQGWERFRDTMWYEARRRGMPLSATFELTPLCNFRCRMCYMRLNPDEVPLHGRIHSADEWLDLARQAIGLGVYSITLIGGEALTRKDFPYLYQSLVEMGLIVSVLSNGALITPEIVELFQTYQPARLRFTLYGASNETYGRLCGDPHGFDKVMRSLKLLKDGGVPFSLAYTETAENVDDTDAALDIADGLGVGIAVTTNVVSPVRGAHSEANELRLTRDKLPHIARSLDNDKPDTLLTNKPPREDLHESLISGPFACCKSYRTTFFVTWNGLMEACAYMSSSDAHPFEEGVAAAWDKLNERLSRWQVPAACQACEAAPFCYLCPGIREAETGSPEGIPPRRCAEARARLEEYRHAIASKGGDTQ